MSARAEQPLERSGASGAQPRAATGKNGANHEWDIHHEMTSRRVPIARSQSIERTILSIRTRKRCGIT